MIFKELGNRDFPTIILLHGGGLSDWSLKAVSDKLRNKYHIVHCIIDGHGEDGDSEFKSIEDSAVKIIEYIKCELGGKAYAIAGLSLGAQIVCEVISREPTITENAVIESALVYPIKGTKALTVPMYQMCYGLIKKRWFARMQAKTLCVPDELFEKYYCDSLKISKQSLINITLSNGNYTLKQAISNSQTKVLIVVGKKEISIMKKSASLLHSTFKNSSLYICFSFSWY